jgi:hypothetical protein
MIWIITLLVAATVYFVSSGVAFAAMHLWPQRFHSDLAGRLYYPLELLAQRSPLFARAYNAFHQWVLASRRAAGRELTAEHAAAPSDAPAGGGLRA